MGKKDWATFSRGRNRWSDLNMRMISLSRVGLLGDFAACISSAVSRLWSRIRENKEIGSVALLSFLRPSKSLRDRCINVSRPM